MSASVRRLLRERTLLRGLNAWLDTAPESGAAVLPTLECPVPAGHPEVRRLVRLVERVLAGVDYRNNLRALDEEMWVGTRGVGYSRAERRGRARVFTWYRLARRDDL